MEIKNAIETKNIILESFWAFQLFILNCTKDNKAFTAGQWKYAGEIPR